MEEHTLIPHYVIWEEKRDIIYKLFPYEIIAYKLWDQIMTHLEAHMKGLVVHGLRES